MRDIRRGDDTEILRRSSVASGIVDPERVPGSQHRTQADEDAEIAQLNKAAKIARSLTVFMTVALLVLWPMPMYGTKYVFSKGFFTGKQNSHGLDPLEEKANPLSGWVVVGIIWILFSTFCVGIFPVWQGRKTAAHTIKSMFLDLTGRKKPVLQGRMEQTSEESDSDRATPREKIVAKAS